MATFLRIAVRTGRKEPLGTALGQRRKCMSWSGTRKAHCHSMSCDRAHRVLSICRASVVSRQLCSATTLLYLSFTE